MRPSEEFVAWAEELMSDSEAITSAAWPRAAALLARAALEAAMAEIWAEHEPAIAHASWRAQLLCLSGYIDHDLAGDIAYAYSALSSACHHHPYDLPPTEAEIRRLLDTVQQLIAATTQLATTS